MLCLFVKESTAVVDIQRWSERDGVRKRLPVLLNLTCGRLRLLKRKEDTDVLRRCQLTVEL